MLVAPADAVSPRVAPAPAAVSRRRFLALGALAAPGGLLGRGASFAEDFRQVPLAPEDARVDPLDDFWDTLHGEFPGREGLRYFNTAGLGIPPHDVLERVAAVALDAAEQGETLRHEQFEPARAAVARCVGALPEEIALVRNATEAMNLVARGLDLRRGDEVILTTHEHPGGAAPWVALKRDVGIVLRLYEPSFDPARDAEAIWQLAGKRTRAVVVSHVLTTTGAVMPVAEIAAEARRRSVWSVVDGAQAAGILPLDLHALQADCYLASGHKWLLGPVETGFLYVRQERLPEVHTHYAGAYAADAAGWSLEEGRIEFLPAASRFEYGTRSPSQAAGLREAIEWQEAFGLDLIRARATALARRFHAALTAFPGVEVLTPAASVAVSPIVTFRVTRRPNTQVAEWLLAELGMRVRLVSERQLNAVRASFHLLNRRPDVDWLAEAVRVLGA
jgi:selenocysteine lyase/cysteine desulfurase